MGSEGLHNTYLQTKRELTKEILYVFCEHQALEAQCFEGAWVVNTIPAIKIACILLCYLLNSRLAHTHDQLLKENEVLQTDHKNLKTLLNNSKLGQTQLEAEFSKLREEYQLLDIKCTKISNQCEVCENYCIFKTSIIVTVYINL